MKIKEYTNKNEMKDNGEFVVKVEREVRFDWKIKLDNEAQANKYIEELKEKKKKNKQ